LIALGDVAGACVAGAVVAAVVAELLPEFPLLAFFVATGFALFVAAAVVFVEEAVAADDDEADATAVVSGPAVEPPAILIALVDPN
jgi:high-affinity Fe2+/Pb2+ permease